MPQAPTGFLDKSRWKYIATTPKAVSPEIRQFAASLAPGVEPVTVDVRPGEGCGKGRCYVNVEVASESHPGSKICHGWSIWELPGVYLNAEHHAVLALEGGGFVDPSPPLGDETAILFLPTGYDPDRQMYHRQPHSTPVPVQFFALGDTANHRQFVELKRRLDAMYRDGRAGGKEYARLDGESTRLLDLILTQPTARQVKYEDETRRKKNKAQRQARKRNRRK
jgi:hypothetical protein